MGMLKCLGITCVTLKVLGLLSSLVALGIPYWYVGDTTTTAGLTGDVKTTIREGLWKKCTDLESPSKSSSFCVGNDVTDVITAIRWLMFVGAGIHGIAVLAAGAAHMEKNSTAFIVAAVHGMISATLHTISAALYATVVRDDIGFELKHLFIGWGLVFVCIVFTILSTSLAFILARMCNKKTVEDSSNDGDDGKGK
ncbi:hypothetical protein ACF0H5_003718 [Mactra antiquata]